MYSSGTIFFKTEVTFQQIQNFGVLGARNKEVKKIGDPNSSRR